MGGTARFLSSGVSGCSSFRITGRGDSCHGNSVSRRTFHSAALIGMLPLIHLVPLSTIAGLPLDDGPREDLVVTFSSCPAWNLDPSHHHRVA